MLDLSLSELGVTLLVAVLLLKPNDIKELTRSVYRTVTKIRTYCHGYSAQLHKELEYVLDKEMAGILPHQKKEKVTHIIDLEGRLQECYDLDDIMPFIHDKNKTTGKTE